MDSMGETLIFLLVLFIILAVITLVGHGIWVLLAWIFGGGRRRKEQRRCAFCGRNTPGRRQRCDWCGRDLTSPMAEELADLEAVKRQLGRFRAAKALKGAVVTSLLARVARYRRGLFGPPAEQPAATPVSPFAPPPPAEEKPAEAAIVAEVVQEPGEVKPAQLVRAPAKPQAVKRAKPQAAVPAVKPPAAVPVEPRKSWLQRLSGLMAERNIHRSEVIGVLAGGLLMVPSSIMLVINLWTRLKGHPELLFLIFAAYSSVVFAAGLYTFHRWKLEATGRGLLTIGTLLVPLNFLAMASLGRGDPGVMTLGAELLSAGIFVVVVGLAARVLVPEGRWPTVVAVVGTSAVMLLLTGPIGPESPVLFFGAGGFLPVVLFGAAVGSYLYRRQKNARLDTLHANAVLTILSTAAFALAITLGLLVVQTVKIPHARATWAVLTALAAVPVLCGGLTIVRGTAREKAMAVYHTIGAAIALIGMGAMLVALGLAWPYPLAVMLVGTIGAAALAAAAFRWRMPLLHAGAMVCAAVAYLTAFHVIDPRLDSHLPLLPAGESLGPEMLRLAWHATSGTALGGLFALFGLIAEGLARRGRSRHGAMYAGGCAAVAAVGLALVTWHGFRDLGDRGADALRAAILYGVYGAGSLALAGRWRRVELSYLGLALATLVPMWVLGRTTEQVGPLWAMVAAAEPLLIGVIAALLWQRVTGKRGLPWTADAGPLTYAALKSASPVDLYRIPLLHVAEIVAPIAFLLGVVTAWRDRATIDGNVLPVITVMLLAAFYLLLAWGYRSRQRTWIASMIVLVGLTHALTANFRELTADPWLVAPLAHCTLALLAGVLLDAWARGRLQPARAEARGLSRSSRRENGTVPLRTQGALAIRALSGPLCDSALLSSVLVLPMLWIVRLPGAAALSQHMLHLAIVWMVIAWRRRSPSLHAAGQAVLTIAAVVYTSLQIQYGTAGLTAADVFRPHSLQMIAFALGLLSLAWVGVRIVSTGHEVARKLLNPPWPPVDRVVRHGVIWLQLLVLASYLLLPGIAQELWPRAGLQAQQAAAGGLAWLVLGVLAVVLIAALWERWRTAELIGTLLVAATVPCLIAGTAVSGSSVGSALRWGLSIWFVIGSLAVWLRRHLPRLCRSIGADVDLPPTAPRVARATLLVTAALPVLAITVIAALSRCAGVVPKQPPTGTFFNWLGPNLSYLVPLLLVMLGLVGHAIRERCGGYAFSAGLVMELAVTLGYALSIVTGGRDFDLPELVTMIQLATIAAAAWAGAWLTVRVWLNIWREGPAGPNRSAAAMMNAQLGMGALGGALLLGPALLIMALFHPRGQVLAEEVGRPLGWVALVAVAAAWAYRRLQLGRALRPQIVGLVGMAALGLLACTVQGLWPEWGYRTLMLGWAAYALLVALATWWVAGARTLPGAQGPPQALIRTAAVWVRAAGILAVLLGIKAAAFHEPSEDLLWAAAAIFTASAAGATMAVWRRKEGWAFAAALGTNLAASLVVWYAKREFGFAEWWLRLVQANVIASAVVALAWLAVRRRLYQLRELSLGESPLLALQIALPIAGNVLLAVVPSAILVSSPESFPGWIVGLGELPGWLGLVLTAAAAAWYLRQALPGNLVHVLGGLGLGAGVLLACLAADPTVATVLSGWFAYHTLTTAWAMVGLLMLSIAMLARNIHLPAAGPSSDEASSSPAQLLFPESPVRGWVSIIGTLVVVLSVIHCVENPLGPWWPGVTVLIVGVSAGMLALWQREPAYVFASGLLLNVIGLIAWVARDESRSLGPFIQANVLGLAVASAAWSLIGWLYRPGVPHVEIFRRPLPFAHLAARLAVGLVALVAAVGVLVDLLNLTHLGVRPVDWIALAVTATAVAICLWERRSRFPLAGLYVLGLSALGLALCARNLDPRELCWTAAAEFSGLALGAAVFGWALPLVRPIWRAMRIPDQQGRWSVGWFTRSQAVLAVVAALLCAWVAIDFDFDMVGHDVALFGLAGRSAGIAGALMLVGTAILMAWQTGGTRRRGWQYAAIAAGVLLNGSLVFAGMDPTAGTPTGDAPWMHRGVSLLVAAAMMTLLSGFGLSRILPKTSDWPDAGRRALPALGTLALAALAMVLVLEGYHFSRADRPEGDLMATGSIVIVTLALAGLIAACLGLAVRRGRDPFGLGGRGRTAYVYAAEVLALLLCVHLRMTVPQWFEWGIIEKYWMLIVMGVAFAGAGLSEWFQRLKLPVLCGPLRRTALVLPLAPAVGFWLMAPHGATLGLIGATPMLWFMMGLFYAVMAASGRSIGLSALAILTFNVGLWVLWHRQGWGFINRPQLWLIPPALAVLVAEYLDRQRLNQAQRTVLRYVALSVIYISSTTEFLREVSNLWLPIVLILLSVAGILAGVWLRVRSFLYLGLVFLGVVILRMIFYAAFQEGLIEVFWIFCILLGAAIIALFAVFEKRRNDVLAAVERFRQWER